MGKSRTAQRSAFIVLFSVIVAALALGGPAAAATPPTNGTAPGATDGGQHCNIVLRKLEPGQQISDVVSTDCDRDPVALANRAPQAATLLSTVFEHRGWKGLSSNIYGYDGPCDVAGYTFDTESRNVAVNGISSYFVYNNCWGSTIWNDAGELDGNCWDVAYVGDAFNDRVHKMFLYDSYWCR
jgi:hypothetical protein